MNIFYLDSNPKISAMYHNDKHVVKMLLESCQLLCSYFKDKNVVPPYRITHYNHPSAKWVRESPAHYHWVLSLAHSLSEEYTHRYGKRHKCADVIFWLYKYAPLCSDSDKFVEPPQCMPDEYKSSNAVEGYRAYYIGDKAYFSKWKNREVPSWFKITEKVLDNSSVLC